MPEKNATLTEDTKGLILDIDGMRKAGWYQQSSPHYHYGLPRTRGLWVYAVEPFEQCRHHPVRLFLLVKAAARGKVSAVETMVCQCFLDGSYDELGVPFNPFDLLSAENALVAALTPEAREELELRRSKPDEEPLALRDLQALIGTYLEAGPGRALIDRLGLQEMLDPLGQGELFATDGKPVEIHVNHSGKVRTVLLLPRAFDRVEIGGKPGLSRRAIQARLGKPSPREGTPQVDHDRFETGDHVTLVTYDEAGNANRISIFSPEVAP